VLSSRTRGRGLVGIITFDQVFQLVSSSVLEDFRGILETLRNLIIEGHLGGNRNPESRRCVFLRSFGESFRRVGRAARTGASREIAREDKARRSLLRQRARLLLAGSEALRCFLLRHPERRTVIRWRGIDAEVVSFERASLDSNCIPRQSQISSRLITAEKNVATGVRVLAFLGGAR